MSGLCSAELLRQSNFTKKGTWSTSVRRASRLCQVCLHPAAVPRGGGGGEGGGSGKKMAMYTLLCTDGSGPATSEPEGLSQPTERWGEAHGGLVAGLTKQKQETGGESLPLFSPSHSFCPVTLACSSGHEPPPAMCLCLTHALGHHTRQGPPAPEVLSWVTALSKSQFWLHG